MSRADEKEREMEDARVLAARGHRAARFLRDEIWLNDLEPALAKIQNEAVERKGWSPAMTQSLEVVAMSNAYFSAIDHTVGEVLRKINAMIQAGDEAEAYLKKSEENSK